MYLLALADTHGRLADIGKNFNFVTKKFGIRIDAILVAGDFGFSYTTHYTTDFERLVMGDIVLPTMTYVVHGNHEQMKMVQRISKGQIKIPNLHLIGSVPHPGIKPSHAATFCNGYDNGDEEALIMGVGGAYNAPNSITDGTIPFDESVPMKHLEWFEHYYADGGIDILLTHECPPGMGPLGDPQYSADIFTYGSEAMGKLWRRVRPKVAISGHYHKAHVYRDPDGLRWDVLPEANQGGAVIDTATWSVSHYQLGSKS